MRFFSLLYTPPEHRDALMALYVIDAEVRESAQSANHDVAHTRLRWWRAEIDRLINRNAQHPATRVLLDKHPDKVHEFSKLHEALAAADMDMARMTYSNERELRAYSVRSGGIITQLCAQLLTTDTELPEAVLSAATSAGVGIRHAEALRDLRQDAVDGRIYLPLDLLDKHGVDPSMLSKATIAPNLKAALREFEKAVEHELRRPTDLDEHVRTRLRPIWVLAALHRKLVQRIARKDFEIAQERVELGPIEKPWAAWRAARSLG